MAKKDFDHDFDFEKEYGVQPGEEGEDAFNFDDQDDGDFDWAMSGENAEDYPEEAGSEDYTDDDLNLDDIDLSEDVDFTADAPRREEKEEYDPADPEAYDAYDGDDQAEEFQDEGDFDSNQGYDDLGEYDEELDQQPHKKFSFSELKDKMPKLPKREKKVRHGPTPMEKFMAYYLSPLQEPQPGPDGKPTRRRKTKQQIFKEVYLPAILAGVCALLLLVFLVGAVVNAFKLKKINDEAALASSIAESKEIAQQEQDFADLMTNTAEMAKNYNYSGAIELLNAFKTENTDYIQQITARKSEYLNAQSQMQEYKDLATIPNLSFHVLVEDMTRAKAHPQYGGSFNKNFVTTAEFREILDQLYSAGYVLCDFDSFVGSAEGLDGKTSYFANTVYLPQGKKPIMITETLANYFNFMIDSNDDGEADAGGYGFASRLVVDTNGDIKAEYVGTDGQTNVGDYDLVPILESFIKEHPDFSYQGARATVAVCGYQGIFGYRINSSYVKNKGQAYVDEQIAGAKTVVEALKAKGYTLACYTFENINYAQKSVTQIKADIDSWNAQIKPVIGDLNVFVFAQSADLKDYTGSSFQTLQESGFGIFVSNSTKPSAEINATYVKQNRLMVTGKTMAWNEGMFTGIFDVNTVLGVDLQSARGGNIPNG